MSKLIDLSGKAFGRWTVIGRHPERRYGHMLQWDCRCECGNERAVLGNDLRSGKSSGCGCARNEMSAARLLKHGHARQQKETAEYQTWKSMKRRCSDPNHKDYEHYGGRGITICDLWMNDFGIFCADMGPRPVGATIDRINPNGNYEPDNCRWASRKVQTANRRSFKQAGLKGSSAPWAKLTSADVREIRSLRGSMSQSAIAEAFGISQTSVSMIQTGKTWSCDLSEAQQAPLEQSILNTLNG